VVLVSSAAGGYDNVMPAAWVMPLDFDPPRIAAVLAGDTYTRELVDASGELTLSVPCAALLDATWAAGQISGRDGDKWEKTGLTREPATRVAAPLVAGCVAWLECRVANRALAQAHDLLVCEVVAAWVDDACWRDGAYAFPDEAHRTFHHQTGGRFFLTGDERVRTAN
jgi:flavin reductase (DIM6/NTAB) family NADH-FMN oxidoreductase RutF